MSRKYSNFAWKKNVSTTFVICWLFNGSLTWITNLKQMFENINSNFQITKTDKINEKNYSCILDTEDTLQSFNMVTL